MPKYDSSIHSDYGKHARLFGRQRPMHQVLGGGKVADVLLWRNKEVSAALLIWVTVIWFLFEVVEYNFVTLVCHVLMATMLVIFVWDKTVGYLNWNPPNIPEFVWKQEAALKEVAWTFHSGSNQLLSVFLNIACGADLAVFLLTVVSLYILSLIGSCFSFLNFLFLGFLSHLTLPYLYDRYEDEVDHFAGTLSWEAYTKFDSNVLNKIPRGPVKDKKPM
ncbi:hypothetical protein SLE2022_296240 [Rubroshorea leprosula]